MENNEYLLHLPIEILFSIFLNLDDRDLCNLSQCHSVLLDVSGRDLLWDNLIESNFLLTNKQVQEIYGDYINNDNIDNKSSRYIYKIIYSIFSPHVRIFYKPIKVVWDRLKYWIKNSIPSMESSLLEPLYPLSLIYNNNNLRPSVDNIVRNRDQDLIKFNKFPIDYICSILIHNGQNSQNESNGLFGIASSYGFISSTFLVSFQEASKVQEMLSTHVNVMSNCWLIAKSRKGRFYMLVLEPFIFSSITFQRGQVLLIGRHFRDFVVVASSYFEFIENHLVSLEINQLTVRKEDGLTLLYRYPEFSRYIKEQVTNGVSVKGSAIYVPEKSEPGTYCFFYRISISMAEDVDPSLSCKLVSREWNIVTPTEKNQVRGFGVIGEYPVIKPGVVFEYCSRCDINDQYGTLSGQFYFISLQSPNINHVFPMEYEHQEPRIVNEEELISVTVPIFGLSIHQS